METLSTVWNETAEPRSRQPGYGFAIGGLVGAVGGGLSAWWLSLVIGLGALIFGESLSLAAGTVLFFGFFGGIVGAVVGAALGSVLGLFLGTMRWEQEAWWLAAMVAAVIPPVFVAVQVTGGEDFTRSLFIGAAACSLGFGWIGSFVGRQFARMINII